MQAGRVKIPGLVTAKWVEERRAVWKENSDQFRSRVLGEFPQRGENNLIAMADIEAAVYEGEDEFTGIKGMNGMEGMFLGDGDVSGGVGAGLKPAPTGGTGRVVIGVDVARFGSDRTVVLMRRGDTVVSIRTFSRIDTMATAGQVMVAAREHRPDAVNVDAIGIGAGLADRLREQGVPARAINVAEKPRRDRTA